MHGNDNTYADVPSVEKNVLSQKNVPSQKKGLSPHHTKQVLKNALPRPRKS